MQDGIKANFDVVVIGSGPAGCSSAIYAAKNGLTVCMIEARKNKHQKPGESFHPGIFSLLEMLGVHDKVCNSGFLRYNGQFVNWGNNNGFQQFGADERGIWEGIHAPRQQFEEILLAEAVTLGVVFKCPCRATSSILNDGRLVGIQSSCGPLYGKYIIDATGGRNWLSQQCNLPIHFESKKLTAFYGYTDTYGMTDEMFAFLEAESQGWSWTARIDASRFAWTALNFSQTKSKIAKIPLRLRQCNPVGKIKGADVTWRLVPLSAGSGYFIVGDAAALLDPLSSDGVIRALMSGILATHCIYEIVQGKHPEHYATEFYRQWVYRLFQQKVIALKSFYSDLLKINTTHI